MKNRLNVQVIFDSIDGEENAFGGAGELTTFIRLKGCNLKCGYCDTKYAQNAYPENWMTIDEIIREVHFPKVTITGGEPLLQQELVHDLCFQLRPIGSNCRISIETNGSIQPSVFADNVRYVMDYKTPSSGVQWKMDGLAFCSLREVDVIKFVISDEVDYNFAKKLIYGEGLWAAKIIFSPAIDFIVQSYSGSGSDFRKMKPRIDTTWPRRLAEMMIKDRVNAQFGLQLHKVLWPGAKEER